VEDVLLLQSSKFRHIGFFCINRIY
jgi:hypothetical protein